MVVGSDVRMVLQDGLKKNWVKILCVALNNGIE